MANYHAFKVVIAYEDFACAVHAREMSERLAAQLNLGIGITSGVWKFDFLRHPQLREEAASDAAAADMIFISIHGTAQLPAHVQTWIESWLPQKRNRTAALVALSDQEEEIPGGVPSACAYLRRLAEKAGVDFFFKAGGWRPGRVESAVAPLPRPAEHAPTMLEEVLHGHYSGPREYGLND